MIAEEPTEEEVSMQIKKMDHCTLVVRDLAKSRWFYGHILGLKEIPRPSTFKFGGCWFQGTDFQIHLILASDTTAPAGFAPAGPADRTGLAHHIAFEVGDLDEALAHFHAHGIAIVAGPMPRDDGVTQAFIYDPDGNFLEFFACKPSPTS